VICMVTPQILVKGNIEDCNEIDGRCCRNHGPLYLPKMAGRSSCGIHGYKLCTLYMDSIQVVLYTKSTKHKHKQQHEAVITFVNKLDTIMIKDDD
jgi:hypothetical protein